MTTDAMLEPVEPTSVHTKRKRGFTLTEIAIVLGIIGLILGAIWVAAAAVYSNLRVSKATTELLQITQGIRALYATSAVVDTAAAGTTETASMLAAGIFPTDAVNGAAVNGPWSGSSIAVYNSTDAVTVGAAFQVAFNAVPQAACIALGVANTGAGRDPNLISVDAAATAGAYQAPAGTAAAPKFFTVAAVASGATVGQATAKCVAGNDDIAFTFRLK